MSIIVGFLLTTVIGGWWASRLQQRSWERQDDRRRMEEEARLAGAACDDLMRLLDKRLYRMRRLFWAVASVRDGRGDMDALDSRLEEYNGVLYEWNDRLNANLALVATHFGGSASEYLFALYEDFRRVGRSLEAAVVAERAGEPLPVDLDVLDGEFEGWVDGSLNQRVYLLGSTLTAQLRDGRIGHAAPDPAPAPTLVPGPRTRSETAGADR